MEGDGKSRPFMLRDPLFSQIPPYSMSRVDACFFGKITLRLQTPTEYILITLESVVYMKTCPSGDVWIFLVLVCSLVFISRPYIHMYYLGRSLGFSMIGMINRSHVIQCADTTYFVRASAGRHFAISLWVSLPGDRESEKRNPYKDLVSIQILNEYLDMYPRDRVEDT
jgi:hypothetical protein